MLVADLLEETVGVDRRDRHAVERVQRMTSPQLPYPPLKPALSESWSPGCWRSLPADIVQRRMTLLDTPLDCKSG